MVHVIFTDWIHDPTVRIFEQHDLIWREGVQEIMVLTPKLEISNHKFGSSVSSIPTNIIQNGAMKGMGVTKQKEHIQKLYPLLHWNSYGQWPIQFDLLVKTGHFQSYLSLLEGKTH